MSKLCVDNNDEILLTLQQRLDDNTNLRVIDLRDGRIIQNFTLNFKTYIS